MLAVPGMPEGYSQTQRLNFLASRVDLDARLLVGALGALLGHLVKNQILCSAYGEKCFRQPPRNAFDEATGRRTAEKSDFLLQTPLPRFRICVDENPLSVNAVNMFSPGEFVLVDTQAIRSLQIFRESLHPSLAGLGRAKESISLFGLVDRTKSYPGKRLLREWFERPVRRLDIITSRLDMIEILAAPSSEASLVELQESMRGVRNCKGALSRLFTATGSVNDWFSLYSAANSFLSLQKVCKTTWTRLRETQVLFGLRPRDLFMALLLMLARLLHRSSRF